MTTKFKCDACQGIYERHLGIYETPQFNDDEQVSLCDDCWQDFLSTWKIRYGKPFDKMTKEELEELREQNIV